MSGLIGAIEAYATVLQEQGIKILLLMVWMSGTVLCTVSPQPSTLQLCSRRTLRSSRLANCHRWCTVFRSPIWTNQAPTPSMTSRLAFKPRRQCVSHSSKLPGCSVYERNSNKPPSWRGGVVGQKENSCIRELCLDLIKVLSLASNAGNSGWDWMLCSDSW